MFGVDFPTLSPLPSRPRTTSPGCWPTPEVTEATARKIFYKNAAELYGFDLELLAPHIERIVFAVDLRPGGGTHRVRRPSS
jgi:hypothetical protein